MLKSLRAIACDLNQGVNNSGRVGRIFPAATACLLLIISVGRCQLADNRINGQIKSVESSGPIEPPAPPVFSFANSDFQVANGTGIKNTPMQITVSTRDQYGNLYYDPSFVVDISVSGGTAEGWLNELIDNGDGTYVIDFFNETTGSAKTVSALLGGEPLSSTQSTFSVVDPRLSFTGNSAPSASIASRIVIETDDPGWQLTGNCDVSLGDVTITSPTATLVTTPCLATGGGTFSVNYNYDTTAPYLSATAVANTIHFYAKQSTLQPKRTWIYKTLQANPPTLVSDLATLQTMAANDATQFYILDQNISASGSNNWTPIGDGTNNFQGVFDGNGHTIDGLDCTNCSYASLFGSTIAIISNVRMTNVNFRSPSDPAGGVVGWSQGGEIRHVYVSGRVEAPFNNAGGIVGHGAPNIYYSVFSGDVVAQSDAYGLGGGDVYNVATYGTVTGGHAAYGIIRGTAGDSCKYCTSDADVVSTGVLDDAAGIGNWVAPRDSYFTGTVTGVDDVGGIASHVFAQPRYTYSLANVTATAPPVHVGPVFSRPPSLSNGPVFVLDTATCTPNCTNTDGEAKSMAELMQRSTFVGWDFYEIWRIDEGVDTPKLRWMDYLSEYIP